MSAILVKILYILIAIIFFGIIIFSHEFGHFLFAKLFKVKVNQFAIGMGPVLFKFNKKETEYSLRLFPVGGYCAMEGEDEDTKDEGSFNSKKVWQRMIIVAAGAIFNLIIGFIVIALMLSLKNFADTDNAKLIGTNQVHSLGATYSDDESFPLKAGDKIIKVDDTRVYSFYDFQYILMLDDDGKFDFTVKRDGEKLELKNVQFKINEDGVLVDDFVRVGVMPTFANVIKQSALQGISMGRIVWLSLGDLITGQYSINDLSGPVGTIGVITDSIDYVQDEYKQTASLDLSPILLIMALITINIGIFNLLPVPALDGGRLFFMFFELIFRKQIPQKYERWIHSIGLILLLILIAVISFNDIWKLIKEHTSLFS